MKCKRHPHEQGGGVCACCLRDRLLALQAAINGTSPENHRRIPPPPVLFPRSVSPYASHHRRSSDPNPASDSPDDRHRNRRFHHTPQTAAGERKPHGCRRFPVFSSIFHHHHDQGPDDSEGSGSWLSSLIHGRRNGRRKSKKKKTRPISSPPPPIRKMKSFALSDRGLSPVRGGDETDGNASESGFSTESSATWRRQKQVRRAAAERHRHNGGGFGGFTVCLSPLVRPGSTSRRSQPPDLAFSGELRSNANPMNNRHAYGVDGGSFGLNRSRKLADRGRFR